jgi:nucleoside triphosphate pyrophosphatase
MSSGLILASASVARARLLEAVGLAIRIEPAGVDERLIKQAFGADGLPAHSCALALAEAKARSVACRRDRSLVIGADQILVCGGTWFDKPSDLGEARAQLQVLRGQTHELATAVCAVRAGTLLWHTVSRPQLTMREFSDGFLDDYIAAEAAALLGSVGAYRLEGRGAQLFERIEGDYFAILGLPLLELLAFLRSSGEGLS